jgi:hypothetical protein
MHFVSKTLIFKSLIPAAKAKRAPHAFSALHWANGPLWEVVSVRDNTEKTLTVEVEVLSTCAGLDLAIAEQLSVIESDMATESARNDAIDAGYRRLADTIGLTRQEPVSVD